jgi:hypothetical protein
VGRNRVAPRRFLLCPPVRFTERALRDAFPIPFRDPLPRPVFILISKAPSRA